MNEEMNTLNTVLAGETPAAPTTPEADKPTETTTIPTDTDVTTTPAETAETVETPDTPDKVFDSPKNSAFAKMRVQNTQMTNVINRLAGVLQLDAATDPEQLISTLEQRLVATEAQQNNIPVELYKKLQDAEKIRIDQEKSILRQQASLAFKNVKDQYKLTDAQLTEFAQQLHDEGKNPYLEPMDLVAAYRNLNFDKILKTERDQAAKEATARDKKATEQSTSPSGVTGRPSEPPTQINTIAGLNELLRSSK